MESLLEDFYLSNRKKNQPVEHTFQGFSWKKLLRLFQECQSDSFYFHFGTSVVEHGEAGGNEKSSQFMKIVILFLTDEIQMPM